MHQITDTDVEAALAAFSKGNHPAHATLEERMKSVLQSFIYSIEQDLKRKALIAGAVSADSVAGRAITAYQIASSAITLESILADAARAERATLAAKQFYDGPMGLLYSVNNGYHDVAVQDLAKVLCRFYNDEKARKE